MGLYYTDPLPGGGSNKWRRSTAIILINSVVLRIRRRALQRRAQEAQVSSEEQQAMLRNLERKETAYMRLQRRKVGMDDFEHLTVIGKGAFGEVHANDTFVLFSIFT